MPSCRLPGQTAATTLHLTALYLQSTLKQEPNPWFAFSGGRNPLRIGSTGAIILLRKKHPDPLVVIRLYHPLLVFKGANLGCEHTKSIRPTQ
jgi:hypothetical protein